MKMNMLVTAEVRFWQIYSKFNLHVISSAESDLKTDVDDVE